MEDAPGEHWLFVLLLFCFYKVTTFEILKLRERKLDSKVRALPIECMFPKLY